MIDAAIYFAVALGASALGGILGMAGGIFIVPILTVALGVPIHVAIGASLVSVIACSCAGAAPYLRAGLTNLRLAIVLETATTAGAVSGVLLTGRIPTRALFLVFAAVLLASAHQMFARRTEQVVSRHGHRPSHGFHVDGVYLDAGGRAVPYQVQRLRLGMALMYVAGLMSSLLGIGSGVLKIPAMDSALRLPIKVSSATSNLMIGVTASASAGAFLLRGDVRPAIAGPVALGSVVGALLGARILIATSAPRLRMLFVAVLLVLSVVMVLGATGLDLVRGSG
jgi:uncharacterized membrane protein YfcA